MKHQLHFGESPFSESKKRQQFVTDTMSIRNSHLEEVEGLVCKMKESIPARMGLIGMYIGVTFESKSKTRGGCTPGEAPLAKLLAHKTSNA